MMRTFVFLLIMFFFGCAKNNNYHPPEVCKNVDGKYDSVILQKIPDPAAASIILQLANLEAVKNIPDYNVEKALKAIDIIEYVLNVENISFNKLIDESNYQAKLVNSSYGLEIFLISQYVGVLNTPETIDVPISVCDKALIQLHLNKQRQMLNLIDK